MHKGVALEWPRLLCGQIEELEELAYEIINTELELNCPLHILVHSCEALLRYALSGTKNVAATVPRYHARLTESAFASRCVSVVVFTLPLLTHFFVFVCVCACTCSRCCVCNEEVAERAEIQAMPHIGARHVDSHTELSPSILVVCKQGRALRASRLTSVNSDLTL